jgi:hypothetical protein
MFAFLRKVLVRSKVQQLSIAYVSVPFTVVVKHIFYEYLSALYVFGLVEIAKNGNLTVFFDVCRTVQHRNIFL